MKTQLIVSEVPFAEYCKIRDYIAGQSGPGQFKHRRSDAPENGRVPYLETFDGSFGGNPDVYSFGVRFSDITTADGNAREIQAKAWMGLVGLLMELELRSKT